MLKDAARPGRPATTMTKGNIEKSRNILKTDARFTVRQLARMTNLAHFESNYSSYYSNYSSIRTLIGATIALREINGGHSSRLSGSLLYPYLTRWVQDLSVASKVFVLENKYRCALFAVLLIRNC